MGEVNVVMTEKKRAQEDALDEALAQSFPASDPPSALTPHPAAPDKATGRERRRERAVAHPRTTGASRGSARR